MDRKTYKRDYYIKNRDRILESNRRRRAERRDEIRAYNQKWHQEHQLVTVWNHMRERCGLRKGASEIQLDAYARRGITVCQEWRKSYKPFEQWALANGWQPGLELDRIDNNGPYAPDNCRFVTHKENCRNRRNTHMFNGRSIAEWYDLGHVDGLSYVTFLSRFTKLHWPMCRALYQPVANKKAS